MPAYDYYCEANGQTVEASHPMTTTLGTWGDLCAALGLDGGETPPEAPLRRLFSTPNIGGLGDSASQSAPAPQSVPCQPGGCPCCN